MAFWSAEKLLERINEIIENPNVRNISHSSYELGVGTQAYITSNPPNRTSIQPDENLVIPPGQFGIILTNEVVTIPNDVIGFISIKAKIKFRGLINVSGFHVDPGFSGRLKFAVYNAGSRPIVLEINERAFLLWIADLDRTTEKGRKGKEDGWDRITSEIVTGIQGEVASPGQLKKDIDAIKASFESRMVTIETRQTFLITVAVGLSLAVIGMIGKVAADHYFSAARGNSATTTSASQMPANN